MAAVAGGAGGLASTTPAGRRGGLWRHRDFLLLWSGQAVSEAGSQVTVLALPLVAIDTLKVGTFAVGALTACTSAAFLFAGLPAGVVVDRTRKRRLMVAADAGRAVVLGSVPVAWWAGALTLAHLYLAAVVTGLLTVFFDVAYQSELPDLVGRDALVEANGKLQATSSGAQVGGPAVAGALVGALGAAGAVAADAVSFVVSVVSLAAIRAPDESPPPAARRTVRADIAEGLRFVAGEPRIRAVAACTATANFFSSLAEAVLLVFLRRSMHLSPALIGVVFAAGAVGGLAGAVTAAPLARRLGVGRTILASSVCFGVGGVLAPLATRADVVGVVVAGQLLASFGAVAYNVNQVSLRQTLCPPALLGRMNASVRTVVWGVMPLGALAGGVLGSTVGLRPALWVAAAGGLTAVGWVATSPGVRSVRRMPAPPVAGAGAAAGPGAAAEELPPMVVPAAPAAPPAE
ncbi:MAG TPA: MFS transporter [Acidimicrobiales bacterium]|nr:MFS transporter [Acidimicrobiales bacterium]